MEKSSLYFSPDSNRLKEFSFNLAFTYKSKACFFDFNLQEMYFHCVEVQQNHLRGMYVRYQVY